MKKILYILLGLLVISTIAVLAIGPLESALYFIKPHHSFESEEKAAPPDYSDQMNWAALPQIEDPSDVRPEGIEKESIANDVNVFFIHPTGFLRGTHWNSSMDVNSATEENTKWMLANQASAFSDCQVYAPRYREATIFSFFDTEGDNEKASLDLAYQDVQKAFDYFIDNHNKNKPFIIASHSQGTFHAMTLIKERIDNSVLADQMIAAYIIGMSSVTTDAVSKFDKITVCSSEAQTNCIIHWATFMEGTPPQDGWDTPMICVNPLSWKADEVRVEANANKGFVASTGTYNLDFAGKDESVGVVFDPLGTPETGYTHAFCQKGRLMVAEQPNTSMALGPGNYHGLDFQLFHMNIRENVGTRIRAFLGQQL